MNSSWNWKLCDEHAPELKNVQSPVYDLLNAIGVDWDDPNYSTTPDRVAKAYRDFWLSGYSQDPRKILKRFPNKHQEGDLVLVKDITFYSTCAHHLAPFFGKAAIAYVPQNHVIGLSKLPRLVGVFSRRLQLQERITMQVSDCLEECLSPEGVMVILYNVEHTCMTSRGVKAHGALTTTSAVRGLFKTESSLRSETLSLLGLK